MFRKIFRAGNSTVISLPKDALELLGVSEGSDVSVELNREKRQIIITSIENILAEGGVDETFARHVSEFIERYRPALETLAKL